MPQHRSNPKLVDAARLQEFSRQFCILVAASDRAKDIFEITFQNAQTIWRDVDWRRYVGFTTSHPDMFGFKSLSAKSNAEWRGRVADYLDALPEEIRYVMLVVEDYLFTSPVDGAGLNAIADQILRDDLAYVRLTPIYRNYAGRIVEYVRRMVDPRPVRPLASWDPYYSSVEIAIWKRDHLRELLRLPGTVWEFEHIVCPERHYAVWSPVVNYVGLVAREKWIPEAPRWLAQQGLSLGDSKRERQTTRFVLRRAREKIVFQLFGYLSLRVRRRLNRHARS